MSVLMPSPEVGRVPEWTTSDRLRKARESAGMDQTELAAITGVSRATISAAENGHRAPSRATVRLWAMATGVPLGWIQQGDSWSPTPNNNAGNPVDSRRVSLPELDSNQQPIGITLAPERRGNVTRVAFGKGYAKERESLASVVQIGGAR